MGTSSAAIAADPERRPTSTSDKLAQRNLAFSEIANPGLDASRVALHTFEIEAAPDPITDLRVIDTSGDHALVQHPDPAEIAAARRDSGYWRETIGAFQLGIPVSTTADMLPHHLRLLSVLHWRAEWLRPNNRWYATFRRYVELIAEKVKALCGDPCAARPPPDGSIDLPGQKAGVGGDAAGEPRNGLLGSPGDEWPPDASRAAGADKPGTWSSKIAGLLFDHFGDFEGFFLEAYNGSHHRFTSRE